MTYEPSPVDTLYLDMEHLGLTSQAQPPLEPRARVQPVGQPFAGLLSAAMRPAPDAEIGPT